MSMLGVEVFFAESSRKTDQMGKKCPFIWCRVIFSAKSFFEIEPNGKKMCTYMVGGKELIN